jgi:Domain of unknown function (DUF1707)
MTAGRYQHMRASLADRERTIRVLQKSFVEGRLTRDELDERLGQALASGAFHELMALVADLPVGPFGRLPAHPSTPPFPRRQPALAPLLAALAWLALVSIVVWAIVTV